MKIILNLEQWLRRRCCLFKDISYPELSEPVCTKQPNHFCNFGRVHYEEHFCEIILNQGQWFRRCHLKTFLI